MNYMAWVFTTAISYLDWHYAGDTRWLNWRIGYAAFFAICTLALEQQFVTYVVERIFNELQYWSPYLTAELGNLRT